MTTLRDVAVECSRYGQAGAGMVLQALGLSTDMPLEDFQEAMKDFEIKKEGKA